MKAWRNSAAGTIELTGIEEPVPGPGEVVVAVEALSPNRGESFRLESAEPGFAPGKDVAGVVLAPAASGIGPATGERVVAHLDGGGWAERAAVPVDRLAVLPAEVDAVTAATLPLAGLTALRLTRVTGPLASRRLLLTGAAGGVGHFFVELAAAQGARTTVVTSSEERARRLLELGATDRVEAPERAAGPFDVGLDSVGGASTAAVLHRLVDDGVLVWFGAASRRPLEVDFFDWSGGAGAAIRKFHYAEGPVSFGEDLATLVRLTASGRLHPEVGLLADWAELPATIELMLARGVRGNAVLTLPRANEPTNRPAAAGAGGEE